MNIYVPVSLRKGILMLALLQGFSVPATARQKPDPSFVTSEKTPSVSVSSSSELKSSMTVSPDGEAYRSSVVIERQNPINIPIVARDNTSTIVGGSLMMAFFLAIICYSTKSPQSSPDSQRHL